MGITQRNPPTNIILDWIDYITGRRRIAALTERNRLLLHEVAIQAAGRDAALAQLRASRSEHANALARVNALECAYAEVHDLLTDCRQLRRGANVADADSHGESE